MTGRVNVYLDDKEWDDGEGGVVKSVLQLLPQVLLIFLRLSPDCNTEGVWYSQKKVFPKMSVSLSNIGFSFSINICGKTKWLSKTRFVFRLAVWVFVVLWLAVLFLYSFLNDCQWRAMCFDWLSKTRSVILLAVND